VFKHKILTTLFLVYFRLWIINKKQQMRLFGFFFLLLTFSLTMVDCQQEKKIVNKPVLAFRFIDFADSIVDNSSDNFFKVSIRYPEAIDTSNILAKSIADTIKYYSIASLLGDDPDVILPSTIDIAAQTMNQNFRKELSEQLSEPENERYPVIQVREINCKEIYRNEKVICFELGIYANMGGAHPGFTTSLFTFDINKGKPINLHEILIDAKKMIEVLEKGLRKSRKIPEDQSLQDAGFLYEDREATLPIPVDYSIDSSGMRIIYNSYEIAPYVVGPSDFVMPFSELDKIINLNILK